MAAFEDQFITCSGCGTKMPLTSALRAEMEASLKRRFDAELSARERELTQTLETRLAAEREQARLEAAEAAARKVAQDVVSLREQLDEQARELKDARALELALRRRERELERQQQDLELTVARQVDEERARLVEEAQARVIASHQLKDAEKERQLADMRRQIEELRRKAEQGSQQLQGEAGEWQLESVLRDTCRADDIEPVSQGSRGADLHHYVVDSRGARVGAILWECKNTRNWSDTWLGKLKLDQRAVRADVAVLVTACLPKGVARFAYVDGVLVTDFASAAGLALILRAQLMAVAQARVAAMHKEERLELLHRYLTGNDFRHRVEAIIEAFHQMRQDLDQERRAAERQWNRRQKQLDAVVFNMAGMYGDLSGLEPALPPIALLELPAEAEQEVA